MNSVLSSLILKEGGCIRCVLRYSGEISINSYTTIPAELLEHTKHSDTALRKNCPLCLGILDPYPILPTVLQKIQDSGYEFENYKFQVTLPSILYLRQEWIYGKCKLSGIQLGRVVEIKDAFKWVFSPTLAAAINKKFSIDSNFRINIDFISPDSEEDLAEFYSTFKANPKESLQSVFKSVNPERLISCFPTLKSYEIQAKINCSHAQVYLYGNYLKLARNISQTPWGQDGDHEIKDSVQDCLSRVIVEEFKGTTGILHSSVIYI